MIISNIANLPKHEYKNYFFKVDPKNFAKGLKEIKSYSSAQFNAATKVWTVELRDDNTRLLESYATYGLVRVDADVATAAAAKPARINYNEEDAEDFGYTNRGDLRGFSRESWTENMIG